MTALATALATAPATALATALAPATAPATAPAPATATATAPATAPDTALATAPATVPDTDTETATATANKFQKQQAMNETVNHPDHYGGKENPYEVIKVIEAWDLGFHTGNAVKYIARCGKKTPDRLEDLKKAKWYIDRAIQLLEGGKDTAKAKFQSGGMEVVDKDGEGVNFEPPEATTETLSKAIVRIYGRKNSVK